MTIRNLKLWTGASLIGIAISSFAVQHPVPPPTPDPCYKPSDTCVPIASNPNWYFLCCFQSSDPNVPYCHEVQWNAIVCGTNPDGAVYKGYRYRDIIWNDFPSSCGGQGNDHGCSY